MWLKQLETTANLHRWTQVIAFETTRSHLTRAAKNWYLANIDSIYDWQSFRCAFANTFMLEKSLTEKWQEMQKRLQLFEENTKEYFFDKVRLCKALKMDLDEIRRQVAVGLWSKDISTAILTRSHFDLDELLRNIVELETLEETRKQRINQSRELRNSKDRHTFSKEGERREFSTRSNNQQPGSPTNKDTNSASKERKCFSCEKVGHLAKECSQKKR